MQVFKFGGASVKSAASIKNVYSILFKHTQTPLFVVVSAMDKTTNALERVVRHYFDQNTDLANQALQEVKDFHLQMISELNLSSDDLLNSINNIFVEIEWTLDEPLGASYDYVYDQVVSTGELLSTHIISAYLNQQNMKNTWVDARSFVSTNDRYREGRILWPQTQEKLDHILASQPSDLYITQGFIGSTSENTTTTLGREGSDFTAAIIAYCINASSVTIWKDVPGVLNADPKLFPNTVKLDQISYEEAIELTYFGASVIHPRTIQPLQNKNIPLYVRSFKEDELPGTIISKKESLRLLIPCFIIKKNQTLLSLRPLDFSFIAEDHLKEIFTLITKHGIKINLMQNGAITFWGCFDSDDQKINALTQDLSTTFSMTQLHHLDLITIRHYNESVITQMTENKKILVEQKSKDTIRFVCA